MFRMKVVGIITSRPLDSENYAVCEIMWENMVESDRSRMAV
jgi:hypothetical protein